VREAGGKTIVTFKGKATVGKVKSREEIEYEAEPGEAVFTVFERLGYRQTFVYEKYRTEYYIPESNGVVTVDETPIGNYAEFEGEEEWIDRVARSLDFEPGDYITASYGALYAADCRRRGERDGNMVFQG
jgi:adenylate cyclase class 2